MQKRYEIILGIGGLCEFGSIYWEDKNIRLEVGVGFSKTVKTRFQEYAFSPRIHGEDVIFLDVGKPLKGIDNYVRADAHYLPFKNCVFEEIYASHLIEHVDYPVLFLRECYRVSSLGGKMYRWCPNFLSSNARADPNHKHSFNYRSLHRLLRNSGFAPSVHGHGVFLGKIFDKLAALLSTKLEAKGTRL